MTLLHLIKVDGSVGTQEYTGPLEYACPPFDVFRKMLDGVEIEHVNVLWNNKLCHMFVDEIGKLKGLPINAKATRIYWNGTFKRLHADNKIYTHLSDPPIMEYFGNNWDPICGDAILWEGEME